MQFQSEDAHLGTSDEMETLQQQYIRRVKGLFSVNLADAVRLLAPIPNKSTYTSVLE